MVDGEGVRVPTGSPALRTVLPLSYHRPSGTIAAMKSLTGLSLASAFLAAFVLSAEPATARSCYSIWAEADRSEGHYRHFVYVENDCDEWLQCSVWTDVNPQPPKLLSVAPGSTESAETNGHSQNDDPRAFGTCRSK